MAVQSASPVKPYRFTPGSHAHDWYVHYDQRPSMIAGFIDGLRKDYRAERRAAERAKIARLGEAYQQLHLKHFGVRH